jgi:hypothetical protein
MLTHKVYSNRCCNSGWWSVGKYTWNLIGINTAIQSLLVLIYGYFSLFLQIPARSFKDLMEYGCTERNGNFWWNINGRYTTENGLISSRLFAINFEEKIVETMQEFVKDFTKYHLIKPQ